MHRRDQIKEETTVIESSITAVETETEAAVQNSTLNGRSVFALDMTASGLAVRTMFLTDQNQLIEMPAMFPDVQLAEVLQ